MGERAEHPPPFHLCIDVAADYRGVEPGRVHVAPDCHQRGAVVKANTEAFFNAVDYVASKSSIGVACQYLAPAW